MIELDVRRVGDTDHVSEISNVICSLKPERSICLLLDLERIEITKVIASLTKVSKYDHRKLFMFTTFCCEFHWKKARLV